MRLNLAAYSTRYKDMQVDFSAVNFVAGRNIGTLETVNAPGVAKIKGFEADLAVKPVEGLTLSAAYAYTDTKFPRAPNPFANNAPVADIPLQDRARLTLSLWSRNLLDEEHTIVVTNNAAIGGLTGIYNEPRTYGLDATIEF